MDAIPPCILECPSKAEIEMLRTAGVAIMSLAKPWAMKVACGYLASDNRFEPHGRGDRWFAFDEFGAGDIVFWHWPTGRVTTWYGRAFALGEEVINNPGTYSFDCALNIFAGPVDWLRAKRDGIVVLDWTRAFDRLRDAPRIALAESLVPKYERYMRPAHMPKLFVISNKRRAA